MHRDTAEKQPLPETSAHPAEKKHLPADGRVTVNLAKGRCRFIESFSEMGREIHKGLAKSLGSLGQG